MASILHKELRSRRSVSGALGKQLLDVITSGMYSDPRMAIREYLQNAADSIDIAQRQGVYESEMPLIQITLDGRERIITVEDNGVGIGEEDIDDRLGSVGCSTKIGAGQRGFRGIGRLGGLAYCDILRFETRRTAHEPVNVVEWSGHALRDQVNYASSREQLADAVRRIAIIDTRQAKKSVDPERFFRVQMINVHRFHSDLLMNVKGLREYLSQTAPVGYGGFHFAEKIKHHLADVPGYRAYNIILNSAGIFRPYCVDFEARENKMDHIQSVELVECTSKQGHLLCRGWFANTGFLAALPQNEVMRGIRIRQGNIEIGDEYQLKDLFSESRFATWHIGELQVTPLLKLNARRDGFEASAEYEEFLEWASLLCRRLSGLCRQSSKIRSDKQNVDRLVNELERKLSIPFFIDQEHMKYIVMNVELGLGRLSGILRNSGENRQQVIDEFMRRLAKIKESPVFLRSILDGRALRWKDNRQLIIDLCLRIISFHYENNDSEFLQYIVEPYLRGKKGLRR